MNHRVRDFDARRKPIHQHAPSLALQYRNEWLGLFGVGLVHLKRSSELAGKIMGDLLALCGAFRTHDDAGRTEHFVSQNRMALPVIARDGEDRRRGLPALAGGRQNAFDARDAAMVSDAAQLLPILPPRAACAAGSTKIGLIAPSSP